MDVLWFLMVSGLLNMEGGRAPPHQAIAQIEGQKEFSDSSKI